MNFLNIIIIIAYITIALFSGILLYMILICFISCIQYFRCSFSCCKKKRIRKRIKKLAKNIKPISSTDIIDEHDICVICLDEYSIKKIGKLKCNHIFHNDCIIEWLQVKQNCPLCIVNV